MKRKLLLIGVAVVTVIGLAVALPATGLLPKPPDSSPGGPPGAGPAGLATRETGPVAVTTTEAVARSVQRTVSVVGSLYGREEVSVSAKTEGRVTRVRHDVGDEVKPGEVLIELDPTDADLATAEAQKGLELELAKLGLDAPPPADFSIDTLPSIVRAEAKEQHTETKYKRLASLRSAGSTDEVAQAEYEYRDAKEALRQARLDAATTLASVRQRQATLNTARQRQADTKVVAPAVGGEGTYLIAQRSVSEGEMVRAGSGGLVKLVLADSLKLQAAVPERYLGEVKVGQSVQVGVEAYPRERFTGTVTRVNPTVDRASRTFQIECAVPNQYKRLAAGCFAKAEVQTRLDPDAVLVPEEALVQFAGVTKVFVIRDGKATAVAVRAGEVRVDAAQDRKGLLVEVGGALKAGDRVAVTGQSKLTDGAAVRMRSESAKGEQP